VEDVPEDFVFYLQCDTMADSPAIMQSRCEQLGEYCGGVIVETPLPVLSETGIYCRELSGDQGIWTLDNPATSGVGVLVLGSSDMKTWRRWLEQFNQCCKGNLKALFVSDEDPAAQQLRQLKTLVELMGL
jgi:hypothetical protein